ncbi:glycerophosphodiester phosphodiesterase [Metabacillus halosaccharovorans]|uniref:glycerophosphodiester phosphodiesterase n=1 Tax=Metabacillus halosaccharovorans TaxID=930124 RepID=UPI00204126FC|nr:glycerophosphodiester phosphodiesterase family protein [Metabacillus halosaccharovorans]MCM3440606.1 glycerophosphodiester phosphodiesterase [Metabacillus halosaccharovorans]
MSKKIFILNHFSKMKTFPIGEKKESGNKLVVAHRGASGYAPENTMAAFEKALQMKSDYLEIDIQMTKDEKLVVIHDPTVDRTTNGTGEVHQYTYEELRNLDAGGWFHKRFTGQYIPTLEEVIETYKNKMGLLVEIKNPVMYPNLILKLEEVMKKCNVDRPINNEIIIQSFDFEWLETFHKSLPNIPLGLLVKYRVHGISKVQLRDWSSLVQYINPNKALITKNLVKRIHSYDMKVMPYTVRDKKSIKNLIDANVDGIITDFPDYFT